ncbi:MAG: CDP-alcohol phosphatidyltransferase family protein [Gammaproteobacteria bacterium]|nr:CDP-alcohol phosphatidyltransferase family protein [Gammaproteobacteria bacterium]
MIDMKARKRTTVLLAPLGKGLARIGVRAWQVTLLGLAITVTGAVFVGGGRFLVGAILVLVGAGVDALDGAVARASDSASERGAFLDAATDRIGETAMWTGLAVAVAQTTSWVALTVLCLGASLIISYLRAKVETGGVDGRGGLMGRAERVILYGVGLLFGWIGPMLWAMTLLTWATVVQRFWLGWKRLGT